MAKKAWGAKVSEGTRLYPEVVKANVLSKADALAFLPAGSKVHKSTLDNRWRVTLPPWKRSRTWSLYGELQALARCAFYIWQQQEKAGGADCPFDWIVEQGKDDDDGE